jgi:hypothetical protein
MELEANFFSLLRPESGVKVAISGLEGTEASNLGEYVMDQVL